MYCNVILRHVRVTIVSVEKGVSITYSECVFVALVIQYATRMRHIILPSVLCQVVPCFFHIINYYYNYFRGKIYCT